MKYKHLFFDLDRTLWDMDANSAETLAELFSEFIQNSFPNLNFPQFLNIYTAINNDLWEQYRLGNTTQHELRYGRFRKTLKELNLNGYNNNLINKLGDEYVARGPMKKKLITGAIDVLNYLQNKKYKMHIITNGFKEVQIIKLKNSGIAQYFQHIITSEDANCAKPNEKIFSHALKLANTLKEESIMIGDDFTVDCMGAEGFGIKSFWLTDTNLMPQKNENITLINNLSDLKNHL